MATSDLNAIRDAFLQIFDSHCLPSCRGIVIERLTVDEAYRVQRLVIEARQRRGERAVGYKVGCTSTAIQEQFGLSEPIFGRLMEPYVYSGDTPLSHNGFHRCAVEPEFAIRLRKDVKSEVVDAEALIDSIDFVSPSIEVHNYRFWMGEPSVQELIASNGIHAAVVIGTEKTRPDQIDWNMEGIGLFADGKLAASGIGAEVYGGPLLSLRWLANTLLRRGEHLSSGDWVIPGSAVRLVSVRPGERIEARFTHLGSVSALFQD